MTIADWAKESARVHALRLAMCEWRADPVGGSTGLVKAIVREHRAPDPVMTRVYMRVGVGHRPNALAFQDLDSYVAAWRDALVKELCEYKAEALACAKAIGYVRAAAPFAKRGYFDFNTNKAHAHRPWRRNAERIAPLAGSLSHVSFNDKSAPGAAGHPVLTYH
jgi:hypothetical protein